MVIFHNYVNVYQRVTRWKSVFYMGLSWNNIHLPTGGFLPTGQRVFDFQPYLGKVIPIYYWLLTTGVRWNHQPICPSPFPSSGTIQLSREKWGPPLHVWAISRLSSSTAIYFGCNIGEAKTSQVRFECFEFCMNLPYFADFANLSPLVELCPIHTVPFHPCIFGVANSRWLGQFQHPHLHLRAVYQQPGQLPS